MPGGNRGFWVAAACLFALTVVTLPGCSKEQAGPSSGGGGGIAAGGKKKIVFVFKIGGISYSEACKEGAEQASADPKINADVEYEASSEGTSEKQADIIDQAIVGHANAIVVSPVDSKAIVPSINKAADQNVKPYTWDSDAPDSKRIFYVAAVDDVQIGVDVGAALAQSMGGKGKVLIFSGQRTAENLNKHVQGIEQGLKKYPGITIVQPYIYNNDDKTTASDDAYTALQRNPDITGIACSNSVSPPAAGEAIRKLHLIGKVKVWGLGLPSENKTYLKDGSVTGLYLWDPKQLTYLTAMLVKNDLDGHPPQNGQAIPNVGKITVNGPLITLPLRLRITRENVDQLNF